MIYLGWPYIFVGSLTDIRKGDELCIEYGEVYWEGMSFVICQAVSVRRSLALGAQSQHSKSRADYLRATAALQMVTNRSSCAWMAL